MAKDELGRKYPDGVVIVHQGSPGDCMYVIQAGEVEVFQEAHGVRERLAVLKEGDFFGEVPLLDREVRSASVRVMGEVRVLMVDKKNFARRIHEDPSLGYRILQTLSRRVRHLDTELVRLRTENRELRAQAATAARRSGEPVPGLIPEGNARENRG